jgi:hypothetical protein
VLVQPIGRQLGGLFERPGLFEKDAKLLERSQVSFRTQADPALACLTG